MKPNSIITLVLTLLLVGAGLGLSACRANIERNADGSFTLEATMTQAELQKEIKAAIADPLVQELSVEMHDGYLFVTGQRKRAMSEEVDALSFRLDLGVQDGHLTARVSEAQWNDRAIEEERVAVWNERLANRLDRAGRRNPNSTLQAVSVGNEAVTMTWRIETARSREN